MIRFEKLKKTFAGREVLRGVSLELRPQEVHFILGKSGAGKSVLLRHVVGQLSPDAGSIEVDGVQLADLDSEGWISVRKKCGMVFQFPALFDFMNVGENVAFAFRESPAAEVRGRVGKLLESVHLSPNLAAQRTDQLSFGEQKRVAIARALGAEPEYLLFDEPTTGLDPVAARAIDRLIRELRDRHRLGCLVVSHDIEAALHIADRITVLDEGKIVDEGTPAEIRRSTQKLVRAFLDEMPEGER